MAITIADILRNPVQVLTLASQPNAERWFYEWFKFTAQYWFLLAFAAGLLLPFVLYLRKQKKDDRVTLAIKLSWIIVFCGVVLLVWSVFSPLYVEAVAPYFFEPRFQPWVKQYIVPSYSVWGATIFTVIAIFAHLLLARWLSLRFDAVKNFSFKRSVLKREGRTDIRTVDKILPRSLNYSPEKFINLKKGIFVGLSHRKKPQYIPLDRWQSSHAQVMGTTGAGKGVAACLLLSQSLAAGESVVVMDPKNDEWAPHVLRESCKKYGVPFYLVNLNLPDHQIDLLAGISPDELEELFVAGFSLSDRGEAADHYRLQDRRAARATAALIGKYRTLGELYQSEEVRSMSDAEGFIGKLEELALLNSINAARGLDLSRSIKKGACLYIIGSMRNSKVITAQRMLLTRLIQIIESRDRIHSKPRPVALFLDEVKYHISRPSLEGLGAARDKGAHLILAHQSIADLRDCPKDLDPEAVEGAVVENCIKIVYRLKDPKTARWVSEMSGSMLVDEEVRHSRSNAVGAESMQLERVIRQGERALVDPNMLLRLPDRVAYIFDGVELPRSSVFCPLTAGKRPLEVVKSSGGVIKSHHSSAVEAIDI